jgi:F-type H+-transporting ATPase subunit c
MRLLSSLTLVVFSLLFAVDPAFAAEGAASTPIFGDYAHLAAGFGIGIAVLGAALGQGKIAAAALEGIGRNPGAAGAMFVPFMIGLALVESLVLFAFLVTNGLSGVQ